MLAAIMLTAAWSGCGAEGLEPPDLVRSVDEDPRAVTIDDLVELRDLGGLSLSPDGRSIAFQVQQSDAARNLYRAAWFVMESRAGATPILVGPGGEPQLVRVARSGRRTGMWQVLAPRWSPDGKRIAYLRREGDATDVYVSAADGSACERLTAAQGDVEDLAWSADGQSIIYRQGVSRKAIADVERDEGLTGFLLDDRFDLFHSFRPVRHGLKANSPLMAISLAEKEERPATAEEAEQFASSRVVFHRTLQGTGRTFTAQGSPSTQLSNLLRERTGKDKNKGEHARSAEIDRSLARDVRAIAGVRGAAVAWVEPANPTKTGLRPPLRLWASLDGEHASRCDSTHCEGYIVEMAPAPDGNGVWFVRREGWALSRRGVYFWNVRENVVRRLLQTDDLVMDCTPVRGGAICMHEGALQPRRIVEISLENGRLTPLFDPNPQWRALRKRPAQSLEWTSDDGRQHFGRFVAAEAAAGEESPLVIVQYRAAGFLRGGVGDEYPIQAFAANGLSVLVVERPDALENYAVEKDAATLEHLEWKDLAERRRTLAAVDAGIDTVLERYPVDPERIGITGLSDGGETANFALLHSRHAFAAAAISGGSRDPSWYYYLTDESRTGDRVDGLGPIGSGADWQWRELGLAFNVERVRAPLLIQVADRELLFDLTVERTLKEAGRPVELYVFPDEYHVKWQPAHRRAIYARNVDWMTFWLRGVEDPDPAKADPYKRWRAMRVQQCELFTGDDAPWYCRVPDQRLFSLAASGAR